MSLTVVHYEVVLIATTLNKLSVLVFIHHIIHIAFVFQL
jgi:hypothetical protein